MLTAGRVGRLWRKESLLLTRLYRDVPFLQSLQSVELFCKIYKRQMIAEETFLWFLTLPQTKLIISKMHREFGD